MRCTSRFFFYRYVYHLDLHSFPTRRSSDLQVPRRSRLREVSVRGAKRWYIPLAFSEAGRSEEHTSGLQSQSNLVCRLLLEKKNQYDRGHVLFRQSHKSASY